MALVSEAPSSRVGQPNLHQTQARGSHPLAVTLNGLSGCRGLWHDMSYNMSETMLPDPRVWIAICRSAASQSRAAPAIMDLYQERYLQLVHLLESWLARHWPELPTLLELTSSSFMAHRCGAHLGTQSHFPCGRTKRLLVSPPFLRGRFKYAAGISSPATGDTFGTRASTASNLSRDARPARSNKYSWVINAATFSAAAELINWFNETPSFSARSDSLR
jgi:hypothetical protein